MIHTHNDNGTLQNNGTGTYMISGSIRGSPNTEHDHQYWAAHIPSWKLYENPFFTEGQFVPKYVPRYLNAPLHRSANSFTSSEAQHAPRDVAPNSLHGLTILAPNFAIKAPIISDANPPQPDALLPPSHLLLSREKCTLGSLVSARKLAASFWEQYGVHKLDPANDHHSSHAQAPQPCLQPPSNSPVCPQKFQIPEEALEDTEGRNCGTGEASENNMASSPAATVANVLHRMRSVEESQSRSTAMLGKLTLEMEHVASRIQELEFSHQSALREINNLLQRFGEQMAISRRKEQEKLRLAFMQLREEMEEERNASRVLKMQNKKLTKDLTHANIAAADACEELDRERKARELLEEVCNELAREIGEDKAEVEQLKQEQAESRERLEEELRMMRMAAAWRGERVRSKLSEVDLDGKEGMPLHELRSKLEAFISTIGVTCRGSQVEMEKQAEQAKLVRQALELLELEESRESRKNAKDVSSAAPLASGPGCTNVCFIDEKASSNTEYGDGGNHFKGDPDTVDGLDNRFSSRKPRKARRRLRTSSQQRQNLGMRSQVKVYDQNNIAKFWETHCANSAWPSSDDELERSQLTMLPSPMQEGHVLEKGVNEHSLHVRANSVNLDIDNMLLRQNIQKMRPSVFARSSEQTIKREPCHLEQNLCNAIGKGSHRKHSSSARFEVGGGMELDCKLEPDTGPPTSLQYSFSEDDVESYMGSRVDRSRKQQGTVDPQSMHGSETMQEEEASCNFIRNDQHVHQHHDHLDNSKSIGRGGADSELDDFYFEPVRRPINASNAKLSYKANENEDGMNAARQLERGFSKCGDEACCSIMAKASQSCKDLKDKVHESAEGSRILASQEVSNVEGSTDFGGKEHLNKMSPWRSTSTKPVPCFWPPSPDAFSIFGGAKKRSKAGSSTPPASMDNEQQMNSGGGLHSHAHRHPSPAKEASYQLADSEQQHVCMKSNSLGAQLIKAREHDKPLKPAFRFSPLRRAISHG